MSNSIDFIKKESHIDRPEPIWMGRMGYAEMLLRQINAVRNVQAQQPEVILGCEHPAVITLGIRSKKEIDLLATTEELAQQKIKVVEVDRGGEATLHNEGQLVIYPILDLKHRHLSVRTYVEILQKTTQDWLKSLFHITSSYGQGEPGVFTDHGKIAFIGVRILNGITYHGIAINLCNDLRPFATIRPCGMTNPKLDTVHKGLERQNQIAKELALGAENVAAPDLEASFNSWVQLFFKALP